MFTGLVEEIGEIKALQQQGRGIRLTIGADKTLGDLKIDDSIAVNGVCQTVVRRHAHAFEVEAVAETLSKTTLGALRVGSRVNLERAMTLGARLGGHLVQGHVDATGYISAITANPEDRLVSVKFPAEFGRYVIPVGSICIDGVSLTAARVEADIVTVAIIPHTWQATTFGERKVGDQVNLEFDMIGKYIEKLIGARPIPDSVGGGLTAERLAKLGY